MVVMMSEILPGIIITISVPTAFNCCKTVDCNPWLKESKDMIKNTPMTMPKIVSQLLNCLVLKFLTAILRYSLNMAICPTKPLLH